MRRYGKWVKGVGVGLEEREWFGED